MKYPRSGGKFGRKVVNKKARKITEGRKAVKESLTCRTDEQLFSEN